MNDQFVVEINAHMVERAAHLSGLFATPVRLRVIHELRPADKSVGEPLAGAQAGHANSRSI